MPKVPNPAILRLRERRHAREKEPCASQEELYGKEPRGKGEFGSHPPNPSDEEDEMSIDQPPPYSAD